VESNIIFDSFNKQARIAEKYGFKEKKVKTILNKNKANRSIFLGDYSLNPYLGCSFNCNYCYINGSKYADSTNSFFIKSNSVDVLRTQLKNKAKNQERAVILIGSATDPYMEIESQLFLTRDILKIANRFKFPVHIVTKSDLILRDIDIFKKINQKSILPGDIENLKSKVIITFSFSTLDKEIANLFEKSAPSIKKRIKAMKTLKNEKFLVGVSLMPMLPYISDTEIAIDEMMSKFKDIGCDYVFGGSLTLFGDSANDSKTKYYSVIKEHFPDLLAKTQKLFASKEYPKASYQNMIYKRLATYSNKYRIKNSII